MKASIYRTSKANEQYLELIEQAQTRTEIEYEDTLMQKKNDTEHSLINLHPDMTFNKIDGFGGAITESAACAWSQLGAENREKFVKMYFDPEEGIGYNLVRLHMNSADFSIDEYTYVEEGDMDLHTFDLSREDKYVVPLIKEAQKYSPDMRFFFAPWTPPKYMKDNNEVQGGHLKKEFYGLYAQYFKKFVLEMEKRGIHMWLATVQNETRHHQTWESCCYTPAQEKEFITEYLGPVMEELGIKLMFYDHCKERVFERCKFMYEDEETAKYLYGIACHWYSGDHFGELALAKTKYPDKGIIMTECCTGDSEVGLKITNDLAHAEKYAHDLLGNLNAGLNGYTDWNIALDQENGPYHNRSGNCAAPIICDNAKDEILCQSSYYYIGHFSKFILPGAKRIGVSSYTDELEVTSFLNEDGKLATVVLNRSDAELPYILRMDGQLLDRVIPAHSIETVVMEK